MNNVLSIYGSHDAAAVFIDKCNKLKVLEFERFAKVRYAVFNYSTDNPLGVTDQLKRDFLLYIKDNLRNQNIDTLVYNELTDESFSLIREIFPNIMATMRVSHHAAHAASGYYTSTFDKALVISIDGGGVEVEGSLANTKVFLADNNKLVSKYKINLDFGNAYSSIGFPISEINPGPDSDEFSLSYPGKVMGLCAYGTPKTEWLEPMKNHYKQNTVFANGAITSNYNLGKSILNKTFTLNCLNNQLSYDLAATSQHVFEELFFDTFWDMIVKYNQDVILVGGCALNVLLNQKLAKKLKSIGKKLYIPPYPSDCGLALGQYLYLKNTKINTSVYSGFDILDDNRFEYYKANYNASPADVDKIVDLIKEGNIIGIIQGSSEIGPRALGNRSIICDPSIKDMKDVLNAKVKFREWYRPFAPVCRYEDRDTFFNNAFESKFMSYAPSVKERYRDKLPSITHVDGTTRLQTVKEEDHGLFYQILTTLNKRNEIPVILNTSFNIKGAPILTTIEDALHVLDNTEMDYVYCNGNLFKKQTKL